MVAMQHIIVCIDNTGVLTAIGAVHGAAHRAHCVASSHVS